MEPYLGIDVAKEHLDVFWLCQGRKERLANTLEAIAWVTSLPERPSVRVVLEATGGYESLLASRLHLAGVPVAIVNPRQVRDFAKALGKLAKTDALDAQELALFAERTSPAAAADPR